MITNEQFNKMYFDLKETYRNQYRPSTYGEMVDENRKALPPWLVQGTGIFEPEGFLTRDEIEEARVTGINKARYLMPNEKRAEFGLGPIEGGGIMKTNGACKPKKKPRRKGGGK